MRKVRILSVIIGLLVLAGLACTTPLEDKTQAQRHAQQEAQVQNQNNAIAAVPAPQPKEFATRKNVARWLEEMDILQPHYVYIYMRGTTEAIGYYVTDSPPTSFCAFLTPPEQIFRSESYKFVVSAPGLDGVYYASGDCANINYFWDESTGAMIQVKGFDYFTSTVPLDLDVPRFTFIQEGEGG